MMEYEEAKNQDTSQIPFWIRALIYGLFHPPSLGAVVEPRTPEISPLEEVAIVQETKATPNAPENNYHHRKTIQKTAGERGYRGRK